MIQISGCARLKGSAPIIKRLVLGILSLNVIVAGIIWISLQQSKLHYQNQALTTTHNISQVLDESITNMFEKIDVALLAISDAAELFPATGTRQNSRLNTCIIREHSRLPEVTTLRATDAAGDAVYGPAVVPVAATSLARRDFFLRLRENPQAGLTISKPTVAGATGKRMIVLSRRLNRPDGSFAGLVYAGVALEYLTKSFTNIDVGPHGSIALFDADFSLIARYPELPGAGGDAAPKAKTPQFRRLVEAGSTAGSYSARSSLDNVERTFSFRKLLLPSPLYVVVGQASSDYLAAWRAEVLKMLLFMAAFFVITAVLSWLFIREWNRNQEAQRAILRGEQRFRSYVENSDDYVFSIATDGTFTYLTPNVLDNFGYHPSEVIGMPFAPFVHPDDLATCADLFRQVLETGESRRDIQYRILHKSGACSWYSANVSLLTDTETGEVSFSGIGHDISRQKQVLNALQESETRFKNLLQDVPAVCVQGYAPDGTVQYWNRASERLYGYRAQEAVGRNLLDLIIPPEMRGTFQQAIGAMAATGKPVPASELSLMRQDGSRVSVFSSHVIVQIPEREPEFFRIDIDLTEQKQWAKQVIELNETLDKRVRERTSQLELALREQEAFSYSVSHDLRSPLRHINSYLAILEEDFGAELSQEARLYMERARSASAMMGKLIDELLEFSRIGRTELVKGAVDLSTMASGIVAALKETDPAREVETVIAEGLTATGDKLLLNLVLENLLVNAWKYSSREKPFRLEFGSEVVNGESLFFVKDNGIGFQMEYHDKIFGVFQRLHGKEYDGTGIGLATVKRIVERHGGSVWAQAELDEGTTFYFNLARDKA